MHELAETEPLPGEWNKKLTEFQKLLLIRAVRPDRLRCAATLGIFVLYFAPPQLAAHECWIGCSCPPFIRLSTGFIPSYAEKKKAAPGAAPSAVAPTPV